MRCVTNACVNRHVHTHIHITIIRLYRCLVRKLYAPLNGDPIFSWAVVGASIADLSSGAVLTNSVLLYDCCTVLYSTILKRIGCDFRVRY